MIMVDDRLIAEIRGDKPSMEFPVLFSGWGGKRNVNAIFRVCPEYIGSRQIALFFNDKRLAEANIDVQATVGSGFVVDTIIPESPDGDCGIILMHIDTTAVRDSIVIGGNSRNTEEIGCEYAIAFYCCGEFDFAIVAFDDENNCEELYTRSFCCK